MATNHDLSYLSPRILEWNESKLPMFIKIIDNKVKFLLFWEKFDMMKFLVLP